MFFNAASILFNFTNTFFADSTHCSRGINRRRVCLSDASNIRSYQSVFNTVLEDEAFIFILGYHLDTKIDGTSREKCRK